jgi:FlaA1/EpsC-like NDP-sugar epimerase
MMDAVVFAKGVVIGTVAAQMLILYAYRFESYSRTVFIIYAGVLLLLLCGTRGSFRLVGEYVLRRRVSGRRLAIYGTGGASLSTIRDGFGAGADLRIVGYIDDNPANRWIRVAGYSVLGGYQELIALIERGEIHCVLLNAHLLDADRLRMLKKVCRERDVELLWLSLDLKAMSAALSPASGDSQGRTIAGHQGRR